MIIASKDALKKPKASKEATPKKERKPRVRKPFNTKNWLISALRRMSLRYPPANRARNRTKEVYFILSKKGKSLRRVKFTCEICGTKDLKSKEVELDHIVPLVDPKIGFTDWNTYLEKYLIQEADFQLICIPCHRIKTAKETEQRVETRELKKEEEDNAK